MNFPATSPTKETSGVTFSVTSRRSLDCGRPTTGSDEGNSSRDFEMNRLAVHHFRHGAPTISRELQTVRSWPDARAGKWRDWVCGEKGKLLRSPVSNHRVFTQSEGAQQWSDHLLFELDSTGHLCESSLQCCCEVGRLRRSGRGTSRKKSNGSGESSGSNSETSTMPAKNWRR